MRNHSGNPMFYQLYNVQRAYWHAKRGHFVADTYATRWLKRDYGKNPAAIVAEESEARPSESKIEIMGAIERLYDIPVETQFNISQALKELAGELDAASSIGEDGTVPDVDEDIHTYFRSAAQRLCVFFSSFFKLCLCLIVYCVLLHSICFISYILQFYVFFLLLDLLFFYFFHFLYIFVYVILFLL